MDSNTNDSYFGNENSFTVKYLCVILFNIKYVERMLVYLVNLRLCNKRFGTIEFQTNFPLNSLNLSRWTNLCSSVIADYSPSTNRTHQSTAYIPTFRLPELYLTPKSVSTPSRTTASLFGPQPQIRCFSNKPTPHSRICRYKFQIGVFFLKTKKKKL